LRRRPRTPHQTIQTKAATLIKVTAASTIELMKSFQSSSGVRGGGLAGSHIPENAETLLMIESKQNRGVIRLHIQEAQCLRVIIRQAKIFAALLRGQTGGSPNF